MVQSEGPRGMLFTAILAGEIVANINVFTGEPHHSIVARSHIGFQTHDARKLKGGQCRSCKDIVVFDDFDLTLKPKNHRLLPADDFHWLVARVQ